MTVALSRLLHVHHAGQIKRARRRLGRRLSRAAAGSAAAGLAILLCPATATPAVAAPRPAEEAAAPAAGVAGGGPARGPAYWLAGADGGVFSFADGTYAGGLAGRSLNRPVVAVAATPDGGGYWLAGADGGVFAFGDAPFFGGLAGARLNAPITGMAATPDGGGYWLAAADGGVFAFGDAPFFGGLSGARLNAPVRGMAARPDGSGYWLAGADGGVFSFGRAPFMGGLSGQPLKGRVVGVTSTWDGAGYWLVGADGGVFSFGDAGSYGSLGGATLNSPVVAMAAQLAPARAEGSPRLLGSTGFDISWPQCPGQLPGTHAFGIVGVTGGQAFTVNPCLATEFQWARSGAGAAIYVNLSPLAPGTPQAMLGPAGICALIDITCQASNYGANGILRALAASRPGGGDRAPIWWLDVETENQWPADPAVNRAVVRGAIDELTALGRQAGVYSTPYQWKQIVGDFRPGVPAWVAGADDMATAAAWCADAAKRFTGGPVWLVQTLPGRFDEDLACPAAVARSEALFAYDAPPPVPLVTPGSISPVGPPAPDASSGGAGRPSQSGGDAGPAVGDHARVLMVADAARSGIGRSAS